MLTVRAVTRVLVYTDGDGADLALPGDIPVAVLLPALHDLLTELGLRPGAAVALASPGHRPLDDSLTLEQNGIRDGAVLTLLPAGQPHRPPALIDPAVAVAAVTAQPGDAPPVIRQGGAVVATVMAALTGFLVVPGGPGLPDALLASAAAFVAAVLSARVAGAGAAMVWFAGLCAVVALAGTLGGLTPVTGGGALTVLSLALLTAAAALVVRASSATTDPALLHRRLAALAAGSAAGAAAGVVVVAGAQPGWAPSVLGAVVAGVLLLRAHRQSAAAKALGACALVCASAALLRLGIALPPVACPIAAALAVAGLLLAGSSGRIPLSPNTDRALGAIELGLLAAATPLACWTVGAFDGLLA